MINASEIEDAAGHGASLRTGFATAADGQQLYYQLRGEGPPILVHNGLVSTLHHWIYFIEHFRRRHQVICWDYRGHGGTPAPADPATVSTEHFAEDAHAVVQATAPGGVIVCGLSFGVQVALEHYRRHPEDVRALVLICGTSGHPLNRLTRSARVRDFAAREARRFGELGALGRLLLRAVATDISPEVAYRIGGAHRSECPRLVLDGLFRHVASLDPQVVGRIFASYFEHSAEDVLPSIRVPTLIVAGDRDELTPASLAERMQRTIPDAELVVFAGHTHLVQVERPGDVHRVIDEFLRKKGLA